MRAPLHPSRAGAWLIASLFLAGVPLLDGGPAVSGQDSSALAGRAESGWDNERVMQLVQRARAKRQEATVDSTFRSYRADARGFVYFFLDRPDQDDHTLVKADQVALEVYWRAPDRTKQRIVGLRDEELLPTDIQYHLDHLTVVQDDFDDRIRLGDGDEVADVVHPVAPGSEAVYEFRLADSLTLSFPGTADTVRVYEVQVRPRSFDRPGYVGALFLDRETGAIVRMSFTFTPVSYVDPYLDYIRISLDNSRWLGRHWLPYRQEVELRRELPQLDFLAGSIIRGRFEIRGYDFNDSLPDGLFRGSRVSAVPEAARETFPFERDLFSQLDEEGLSRPPSLDEVERQVREISTEQALSGLRRTRLHVPSVSHVYRFNRAEGHALGVGASFTVTDGAVLRLHGGWALDRERPRGSVSLGPRSGRGWGVEGYLNRLADVGPVPAAAGVINTLAALVHESDYLDPYFASGARVWGTLQGDLGPLALGSDRFALGLRVEEHRSAEPVLDGGLGFRPLRPVARGTRVAVEWSAAWGGGADPDQGWGAELRGSAGLPDAVGSDLRHDRVTGTLAWGRTGTWRDLDVTLRLDGGVASGADEEPQALFLLGGRGTLLGYGFRRYVGDRFWLGRVEAERALLDPLLSVRAFASAGQARLDGMLPAGWDGDPDGGVLASFGGGVGLFWDVLRIDVGRGVHDGADWEVAAGIARRFHGWL